jgi:predicted nucleotide-binding protein
MNLTMAGLGASFVDEQSAKEFESAAYPSVFVGGGSPASRLTMDANDVDRGVNVLVSLAERVNYLGDLADSSAQATVSAEVVSQDAEGAKGAPQDRQVFIVHGRDDERKLSVARLLERTGPHRVTILHEQPNRGRTLIEKFEDNAAASDYAVILLTADDVGGLRPDTDAEPSLSSRARQNVVFEMGFFAGALGRTNVCVLYEDGVELPSDIAGVAYVPLDAGGAWQSKLLLELRSVGFEYDLNKLA